jgi:hypothetical protein
MRQADEAMHAKQIQTTTSAANAREKSGSKFLLISIYQSN